MGEIIDDKKIVQMLKVKYSSFDTSNFNVFDFIYRFGGPLDALMYLSLFWPQFIEKNGMVFLKETFEDEEDWKRLEMACKNFGGDRLKIEESFNYFEISGQLIDSKNEVDEVDIEVYGFITEKIKQMWEAKLKLDYPNRKFVVKVVDSYVDNGEIGIIFYQK